MLNIKVSIKCKGYILYLYNYTKRTKYIKSVFIIIEFIKYFILIIFVLL